VENIAPLISEILAAAVGFHEIVFVDDHSTNGTTDVIRSFAASHPIRLVEQNSAEPGLAAKIIAGTTGAMGELLITIAYNRW
jgi:glycosyltransferase involved in cell wall biosynthesis